MFTKLVSVNSINVRPIGSSASLFAARRSYGVTAPGVDIPRNSSPLKSQELPFAKERREIEESDRELLEKKLKEMKTGPIKVAPKKEVDDSGPKPAAV